MSRRLQRWIPVLLVWSLGVAGSPGSAAHPPIPLLTYPEVAAQYGVAELPVAVDGAGKGLPYSPKATCGACHDGNNAPGGSYAEIEGHAFHSQMGMDEWLDEGQAQDGKPWTQSTAMYGKW